MMNPKLMKGGNHQDKRGTICFNNDFNAAAVKRVYTIENESPDFIRAWQGHKIEQRWFSAMSGTFIIKTVRIDDWENPSKDLPVETFLLGEETLDILHIPAGFLTSIQQVEKNAKLLVFADYALGEIADDYRFQSDYFNDN